MSLINNVLRDLDKRRAGDEARRGLPNDVRPLPDAAAKAPPWRLLALVAAGAAAVAGVALWPEPAPVAVPPPAKPIAATPPAAVPPATPVPAAPSATPAPTATPAAPAPVAAPVAAPAPVPPASTLAGSLPARGFQADVRRADAVKAAPAEPPAKVADGAVAAPAATPASEKAKDKPAAAAATAAERPKADPKPDAAIGTLRLDSRLLMPPAAPRDPSPAQAAPPVAAAAPSRPAAAAKTEPEDDWTRAQALLREGRAETAEPLLRRYLQSHPTHVASRQALLGILLPARRHAEALETLRQGVAVLPEQTGWAMNLARLQAEGNDYPAAWETLSRSANQATQNPEYLAFCGTVLQRLNRSGEAIGWYRKALQIKPREARWWVGMGIALEAEGKLAEAREAYQRGRAGENLPAEVAAYAEQRLAALR